MTQATARCLACLKPICKKCTLVDGDRTFCSPQCVGKQRNADEHAANHEAFERKQRRARLIYRLVCLGGVIIVGLCLWIYWKQNPDKMQQLKEEASKAIEKQTNAIRETSKTIQNQTDEAKKAINETSKTIEKQAGEAKKTIREASKKQGD
jgi:uncharacterized protein HemX